MFTKMSSRSIAVALVILAVVAQGCSTDDPTEVTLEDLTAQLKIEMGANEGDGGAAAGTNAVRSTSAFESEPSESQFRVLGPNLNVFSWPIIQDTPINARWQGGDIGDTMVLGWPCTAFPTSIWPNLNVAGGTRYGNTWVVYPAGGNENNWVAQHTEWIRRPGEQCGSAFHFEDKLEANRPCNNCPIGQFVAGPSRHVTNQPEFRRRTAIRWFRYGDLSPWVWQDDEPDGPTPTAGSVLEEVHVFVQKLTVTTDNGTEITFNDVNKDIDLMTLRGEAIAVVDSEIPRGTFEDIEFTIATGQSYVVVDGEQRDLDFGTGTVVVEGPIVVGEAPIVTVRLTFDVEASLTMQSDGGYKMAPVVVIEVTTG